MELQKAGHKEGKTDEKHVKKIGESGSDAARIRSKKRPKRGLRNHETDAYDYREEAKIMNFVVRRQHRRWFRISQKQGLKISKIDAHDYRDGKFCSIISGIKNRPFCHRST